MEISKGIFFEIYEDCGSEDKRNAVVMAISHVGDLSVSRTADFIAYFSGNWERN